MAAGRFRHARDTRANKYLFGDRAVTAECAKETFESRDTRDARLRSDADDRRKPLHASPPSSAEEQRGRKDAGAERDKASTRSRGRAARSSARGRAPVCRAIETGEPVIERALSRKSRRDSPIDGILPELPVPNKSYSARIRHTERRRRLLTAVLIAEEMLIALADQNFNGEPVTQLRKRIPRTTLNYFRCLSPVSRGEREIRRRSNRESKRVTL